MPCKCSSYKITDCKHCGFPRYRYNKSDYYQIALDYYISSKSTLVEVAKIFDIRYSKLSKELAYYKKYYGYGNFKRRSK